ncbi:amidase signature domain-containing protein [Naematelia encephala]|uniref:amidase n=1 Tax=Naematelia encephala TaxID=71784 RepID=A0A1Y2AQJ6_9TREE|nr:amidase signature domain-containing protein [Naematelia encephala]
MVQAQDEPVWPKAAIDARQALLEAIPEFARLDVKEWAAKYPPGSDVRSVAAECGLLTDEELEITSTSIDATDILAAIKNRKWSAEQVCLAFGKRACIAHQLTSCLSAIFIEEGLSRARELDEYYRRTGKLVGPLHGLPFDVKEHYRLKGHRSTMSALSRINIDPEPNDNTLLTIFRDAGAVFYVKSNLPQIGMHLETKSFWGETLNPWNTNLTPGGSSGGGSSLVAFGGAPISLGGDIGGSLRAPAAACGLWTLKPTTQRLPREKEAAGPPPQFDSITGCNGPIARSLRDCQLFLKTVLNAKPWMGEQSLVPLPWREASLVGCTRPLRIGIMSNDGVVIPQPPIRRALRTVAKALAADKQFELVDFIPYEHEIGVDLVHELYFPDGGHFARAFMASGNEQVLPLTDWVLSLPSVKNHTLEEYSNLLARRNAYRANYLNHFNAQNVDVILCPAGYGPAQALGTTKYWGYTCIFNLVDYPAAVFPTGLVSSTALDPKDPPRVYLSDYDKYVNDIYEPTVVENAPLGLQLVGRRFHEEDLMHILGLITAKLSLHT